MALNFEDVIQSQQFTFFVGQEGKPIVVHAAAIAATSKQLHALINGGMEESTTACARIEDVLVEDFIRFCEYAYRGDYTTPPWELVLPEPSVTSSTEQQNWGDDPSGCPTLKPKKKSKRNRTVPLLAGGEDEPVSVEYKVSSDAPPEPEHAYEVTSISRISLRTQFNSRTYLKDGGPKTQILQQFKPTFNTTVDQNFTPVLLAHARLYCFAHLHLVEPLKSLTLQKLHETLMNFKLFKKRIGDIIELARFAYSDSNLPDRGDDGTIDDLRILVVEYIVCEIDTIGKRDAFAQYMEEGGEFVGDFWKIIRNYMV